MTAITSAERILLIVYSLLLASVFLSEWLFRSGNISERARGNVAVAFFLMNILLIAFEIATRHTLVP